LTAEEFEKVVKEYHEQVRGAIQDKESEYRAIVAAMNSLCEDGYDVRVVFWFDN